MGLLGILLPLGLLIWLAYRGWSVLLLAPATALLAVAVAREPLLAHWTQTFMGSAAQFLAQFFPLFLLGALFGKLMDDIDPCGVAPRGIVFLRRCAMIGLGHPEAGVAPNIRGRRRCLELSLSRPP